MSPTRFGDVIAMTIVASVFACGPATFTEKGRSNAADAAPVPDEGAPDAAAPDAAGAGSNDAIAGGGDAGPGAVPGEGTPGDATDSAETTPDGEDADEAAGKLPPKLPELMMAEGGLKNGHFDLDTSRQAYPANQGKIDHHEHAYDDKSDSTGADFFDLTNAKFVEIDEALAPAARFRLVVLNAKLSPGAVVGINGALTKAGELKADQIYSLGAPAKAGDAQLKALTISFSPDALGNGGLVATAPDCVRRNKPGPNGEHRNGALTLQAVDAASKTVLWETMLYWHRDGRCLGETSGGKDDHHDD